MPGLTPRGGAVGVESPRAGAFAGRKSWLKSTAQGKPLLYVTDSGGVTIYSNSGGNTFQLAGELFGFQTPAGECTDARGNVFITDETARVIDEYARGAVTPKAVIPDNLGQPLSCSIDRNGRMAVTNFSNPSGGEPGNVIIYPSPSQTPTEYSDSLLHLPLYCSFDRKGNLYVAAYDTGYHAVLSELPNGSQTFTILSLSGGKMNIPGWVLAQGGSQLLLGDIDDPKTHIYQLKVHGSVATVVGTIPLSQTEFLAQFVLFGSGSTTALIAPDNDYSKVQIYSFPGGSVLGSITSGISQPVGVAISK